jgi:hypothetical protein
MVLVDNQDTACRQGNTTCCFSSTCPASVVGMLGCTDHKRSLLEEMEREEGR